MATKPKITTQETDPKENEKLEKAVLGGSEAPTAADVTRDVSRWRRDRDISGPPFDVERLTVAQMRQMRKDPMFAFGLHYRKVPLARSEWIAQARDKNGPNAQIAGFIDACLRPIFTSYIFQRTLAFDFGFQAIVKQWQLANPGGVYLDRTDLDEFGNPQVKPVWDEGTVLPKVWKPFAVLPPERSYPKYVEKGVDAGNFDGINYERALGAAGGIKTSFSTKKPVKGFIPISVYNSLWATNHKWDELGDLYGYPLTGFGRDYWWDYLFVAGLQRRAFERIALPPILAWYPPGETAIDSAGTTKPNWEIAIEMADRMRSNSLAAVPSTMAETGIGETSSSQRAWDFKYMETPGDIMGPFDQARNYYNVQKLRSIFVPEMAFIGRESGNSGGNIAGKMQEIHEASQELTMIEILDEVDRYMIPQLLTLNFPEFVNEGGKAWIEAKGFRREDLDLNRQIIQLFGQADPTTLADIDTRELLQTVGLPLKDPAILAAEREFLTTQAAAAPLVAPTANGVGVISNPNVNQGFTNGGSVPSGAGFAEPSYIYVNPPEHIELAGDVDDFIAGLPKSTHYSDKTVRSFALQLRKMWLSHFRRIYPEFAKYLDKQTEVQFADGKASLMYEAEGIIELANGDGGKNKRLTFISETKAKKLAKKLIDDFKPDSSELRELRQRSADIMRKMLRRGISLNETKLQRTVEVEEEAIDAFVNEQTARLLKLTHQTLEDELRSHLVNEIKEGKGAPEIAAGMVSRFESLPTSKADRIARSETRDVLNAATLISSESAKIRYVKAHDGEQFDQECADRNGKLFTVKEAWRELRKEHPYGTLGFEPIPRANFSIEWVEDAGEDCYANFDDESSTAYIQRDTSEEIVNNYLTTLADHLIKVG